MKKQNLLLKRLFFIMLATLVTTSAAIAQNKRKKPMTAAEKKRARTEQKKKGTESLWLDKMWYGADLHYPTFGNGIFTMSLSPRAAYKFNRWLSTGVVFKGDYYYERIPPNAANLYKYENLNYGVGLFARTRIVSGLFAQVEYEKSTFKLYPQIDFNTNKVVTRKISQPYFNVGLGWSSGLGKWQTQIAIYRNLLGEKELVRGDWDILFGLTYNF